MKKQWCAAMSIISAAVLITGFFPEAAVSQDLCRIQQVSAASIQDNQAANLSNGDDMGSAETEETSAPQNQTEPVEIVASVKNLAYMGNRIYPLTAGRDSGNNLGVSSVGQTGILYAAELDMDEDGNKEILAVTYENSSQIAGENTIHLSILKQSDGNWNVLTETEVLGTKYGDTLYDVSFMKDSSIYYEGSVFLRKYNGKYEIFYEYYGEGMFATGQTWFMRGFRFENNTLSVIPETENIFYEGSPITMLWDETYDDIDAGTYEGMLNNYCSLGFQRPNISFEHMTMNQNQNLYLMLRLILGSDSSKEEVAALVSRMEEHWILCGMTFRIIVKLCRKI